MNLTDVIPNLIRTTVVAVVGAAAGWLAARGINIDSEGVTAGLMAAATLTYQAVAVFLQQSRFRDLFIVRYMLGHPAAPTYSPPAIPPAPAAPSAGVKPNSDNNA